MAIRVCVAGATGWTGRAVTDAILASSDFQLVGAIARRQVGVDIGEALGHGKAHMPIVASLEEALAVPTDVLIDYTAPEVVKEHILAALDKGVRVVVGTSGLTASDYSEIEQRAQARQLGVIAAGNFSLTAALAKRCAKRDHSRTGGRTGKHLPESIGSGSGTDPWRNGSTWSDH